MDVWDLTKVLFRRWMIVIPMLMLTGALGVEAERRLLPDYVATAFVQLVPPTAKQVKTDQATLDQRNPWAGLGLPALGNAAIVMVSDRKVADELEAAGDSRSFTLTMDERSPLVTFQAVGKWEEQASATANHLVERFGATINSLQKTYGVADPDLIAVTRLDLGTNIHVSDSKVKRALIAAVGAGLLLTIAVTVGIDGLLQRWRRRRRARQLARAHSVEPPPGGPAQADLVQVPRQRPAPADPQAPQQQPERQDSADADLVI